MTDSQDWPTRVGHRARMEEPTCPDFTPTLRALLPSGTRVIPAPKAADLQSLDLKRLTVTLRQSGASPAHSSPLAPLLP